MLTITDNKVKTGDYREIITHIGGHRFLSMTGTKIKYYGYNDTGYVYVMLQLVKNQSKANHLKIQLNSNDLYDMEFIQHKKTLNPEYKVIGLKVYEDEFITVNTYNDLYYDQLEEIFTSVTGLYTKLF